MMAALSTAVLFLTGAIPTMTIALPAVAGCLLIPVVAELGKGWGLGTFLVCGVLSFLLTPDREAAALYLFFFGYYPVLMPVLERIPQRVLRWGAKLLLYNAAVLLEALFAAYVLGIPLEGMEMLGKAGPVLLLLLANVLFVLYDLVLKRLVALYLYKLHGRVRRMLKLK